MFLLPRLSLIHPIVLSAGRTTGCEQHTYAELLNGKAREG